MKTLFLITLFSLGLIGCQSNPIHTVETKTIYLGIPDRFKEPCKMEKPITKETYLSYTSKEKEGYLYSINRENMLNIIACNKQLDNLVKWDKEQKKIYGGENGQKKE
jgi:hypothetical protein